MNNYINHTLLGLLVTTGIISPVCIAQTATTRTITFVNNCPYPVWFGLSGGSAQSKLTGTECNTNNDCYTGTSCVPTGNIKQCFWINPQPSNNNYQLAANGGSNQVSIPIYNDGPAFIWSGVAAARTNCTGSTCQTADCGSGPNACLPGQGFNQPATQAEFTFSLNSLDYYDVEVINGFNVPLSMAPVLSDSEKTKHQRNSDPYSCGSPGAATPSSPLLGACTWQFTPPSNDYNWVQNGGNACSSHADCASPAVCGISFNPGQTSLLQKTCGIQLGYWTADQICGINSNYGAPFNCSQAIPQNNFTLWNLYACVGNLSCYASGAATDCCGCVNWDQIGISVPPAPYTQQCVNTNPYWNTYSQPTLTWLKSACPTAYAYPFDDMSSTFTCGIIQNNVNTTNYTITYCPTSQNPPPPSQQYSYYVYVGSPFNSIVINHTITCPDPTTHNPACLVANQSVSSLMVITGSNANLCHLTIENDGSIMVNNQSNGCLINTAPATSTIPGTINLPSGF